MFDQENGCENAYLVSVYNFFINLCQFQCRQVKSIHSFDHLFFGEKLMFGTIV